MLGALNITKWFSRLCWNFNVHFGQPAQEPVLAIDEIYSTEQDDTTPVDALPFAKQENIGGDVMLVEAAQNIAHIPSTGRVTSHRSRR